MDIFKLRKEHLKNVLNEYRIQKSLYEFYKRLSEEWSIRLRESYKARGIDYEREPTQPTTYENELIIEEATYALEMEKARKKYERIEKEEHLEERMNVLDDDERKIIMFRYFYGATQQSTAKLAGFNSKEYICKKEDIAFNKMTNVEI